MESTGAYHLPVLNFLKERGFFVSVVNPMVIQKYAAMNIRKVKTDRMDALNIARFGMDCWQRLTDFSPSDETYAELRLLSRQYLHYIALLKNAKLNLTNLMDHLITKMSEDKFVAAYAAWTKKTGHHSNETKARGLYTNALEAIPTLPSRTPSTKMLVLEGCARPSEC